MKIPKLLFSLLMISCLCSCTSRTYLSKIDLNTPSVVNNKITVKSFETQKLNNLDITLTNASVTFSSWAKKQVNIEVETSVISNSGMEVTEQLLANSIPDIKFAEDSLIIKESNSVNAKKTKVLNRIVINAPYEIKNFSVKVNSGDFISVGDLATTLKAAILKGNISLARFKGIMDTRITEGNFSIDSGRLVGASKAECENGNIKIKTEFLNPDTYRFETGTGNVEIQLPARTPGEFLCQGNVAANNFISSSNGSKFIVSSKQGTITIKKY